MFSQSFSKIVSWCFLALLVSITVPPSQSLAQTVRVNGEPLADSHALDDPDAGDPSLDDGTHTDPDGGDLGDAPPPASKV